MQLLVLLFLWIWCSFAYWLICSIAEFLSISFHFRIGQYMDFTGGATEYINPRFLKTLLRSCYHGWQGAWYPSIYLILIACRRSDISYIPSFLIFAFSSSFCLVHIQIYICMWLAIEVFTCFVMKKIIYIHLNIFKRISNHNLHFFNFWRYSIQCATMILRGFTICLYICWLPAMVSVIIIFFIFLF